MKTRRSLGVLDDAFSASTVLSKISANVATNNLTLNIDPQLIDFRSTALNSGSITTIDVKDQISLIVPSGATLGSVDTEQARLILIAINNSGVAELAVVNEKCSLNLDETGLISTTAITTAADDAAVIYSGTARSNVAYRIVGFVDITETVAGVWADASSLTQGAGGESLKEIDTEFGRDVILSLGIYSSGTYTIPNGRSWADYDEISIFNSGHDVDEFQMGHTVVVPREVLSAHPTSWYAKSHTNGTSENSTVTSISSTQFTISKSGTDSVRMIIGRSKRGIL